MKTVLIYVISSPGHPYPLIIDTSLKTWDSCHVDGVETLFYWPRGKMLDNPKMVQFNVDPDLWAIGHKNIAAFKWAVQNRQWDFMARVNVPTYVNKRRLWEAVQSLPTSGVIRGVCAPYEGRKYLWGGLQFIMSRDVVDAIARNGHRWNHGLIEDVAMSMLAQDIGFELDCHGRGCAVNKHSDHWSCIWYDDGKQGGFDFHDFKEMHNAKGQFFYRTKQNHIDRHWDIFIMEQLYKSHL